MSQCERKLLLYVMSGAVGLALGMGASPAHAFHTGITTLSFGAQGCNQCHLGGTVPTVTLTGPTTVDPDSTNEYTLKITNPDTQPFGGLNVSANFGTLSTGGADSDLTQPIDGTGGRKEITHLTRKPAVSGMTTFSFQWTAPGSFTSATFSAWGNAVNGDGTSLNDAAKFVSLTINSSSPGQNPTATPTATPIPTPTPIPHDAVVAVLKPLNVTIPKGAASVTKTIAVKVTNANAKTDTLGFAIQLAATHDCPAGVLVGVPNFGSAPPDSIVLAGGKSKTGKVALTVPPGAFANLNQKAPSRCTITFQATSFGGGDPTPDNNIAALEVNVIDKNNAAQATVDESFAASLAPLKVTIPDGGASVQKTVKAKVGNADILPVAEKPGDTLTVTASDGDCPPGTIGAASPNQVTVQGGKTSTIAVPVTINASLNSPSAKSPARCAAVVNVTGPTDPDPDPTNNATMLWIEVVDKNDF